MRKAAELLATSEKTIEAIAFEIGYHNPFRLFQRLHQVDRLAAFGLPEKAARSPHQDGFGTRTDLNRVRLRRALARLLRRRLSESAVDVALPLKNTPDMSAHSASLYAKFTNPCPCSSLSCPWLALLAAQQPPGDLNATIEKHRKGILVIEAAPGTEVHVEQQRHEFWFGAALANQVFSGRMRAEDREKYLSVFLTNFNCAVTENALKWHDMEPRRGSVNYATVDAILAWTDQHQLPLRGHNIFWGIPNRVQDWLKNLPDDEFREALKARALDIGRALSRPFRGIRSQQRDDPRQLLRGAPGQGHHAAHGAVGSAGRFECRPLPQRLRHPHRRETGGLPPAHPHAAGPGSAHWRNRRAGTLACGDV